MQDCGVPIRHENNIFLFTFNHSMHLRFSHEQGSKSFPLNVIHRHAKMRDSETGDTPKLT